MTKIPSVEERVEEIDNMIYGANLNITQNEYVRLSKEMRPKLIGLLTADRLALLTELRDSELLEEVKPNEKGGGFFMPDDKYTVYKKGNNHGHNTLAKAIKARLNELIKSTEI